MGEAARDGQSWFTKRLLGTEPCLRETTLGAWMESHTEVGGVLTRLTPALAFGVAERLGYIVLARESGRGGEEARAAFLVA